MTLDRCFTVLERNQIPYSHSVHPAAGTAREVAAAERIPAHRFAKLVVYHGDTGFGILMLPSDCVVDFGQVLRLLGLSEIRMATEDELVGLFPDCDLGAMPPFGNLVDLPILVEESLEACEFISFSAGTHRDVIHMSFADFRALVNPLIAAFAIPEMLAAAG